MGGPLSLTAGLLGFFIPAFAALDPATPLRIDLQPTIGPMITGAPGPSGELAEMKIPHLLATVLIDDPGEEVLLSFAVDVDLGLDFIGGALSFELGTISAANIDLTILENTFAILEPGLIDLLELLLPLVLPSLAGSLGTFPLPDFLGLQLDLVEISKNGAFMSLFVNLTPVP